MSKNRAKMRWTQSDGTKREIMYRIGKEEVEALARVVESRVLFRNGNPATGHQQAVARFEQEWAQTIGTEYALCVSGGGTAALICGLAARGIGPGDEVIVPAYTFMATALAVCAVGAIPVLAEVDETLTLDPDDLARKVTPQTRAVIPVHIAGRPCDMVRILNVARQHDLYVLEDCSQSDGGSYRGRRVGSWGDAGVFSFNDFKILSCGEGGTLVTSDRAIYDAARLYHDGGALFRFADDEFSVPYFAAQQYRASELMGAVLRVQLQRLEGILTDLRKNQMRLVEEIGELPGMRVAPNNDAQGDCGLNVAFQFDSEETARAFALAAGGHLPIDTGKHVYCNWTPIMQHRIGHHPDMNPYNHPKNQKLRKEYSAAMCPQTLDILSRTVMIGVNPDWTPDQLESVLATCHRAAEGVAKETAAPANALTA
jgi:dTDP-4-amino-4,6-dideoxygalactose transaminase